MAENNKQNNGTPDINRYLKNLDPDLAPNYPSPPNNNNNNNRPEDNDENKKNTSGQQDLQQKLNSANIANAHIPTNLTEIAGVIVHASGKPLRTNENTFYENQQRYHKVASMASTFIGDTSLFCESRNLDVLLQSKGGCSGNPANLQSLCNYSANVEFQQALANSNSALSQLQAKVGTLQPSMIQEIAKTGMVTHTNAMGNVQYIKVTDSVKNLCSNYVSENKKNSQILSARTEEQRAAVMKIVRHDEISKLQQQFPQLKNFHGSEKDIREFLGASDKKVSQEAKTAIRQFRDQYGSTQFENHARHRNYTPAVRKIVGEDMYGGYQTTRQITTVTTKSVRAAFRLADGTALAGKRIAKKAVNSTLVKNHIPTGLSNGLSKGLDRSINRQTKRRNLSKERTQARRAGRESYRNFQKELRETRRTNRQIKRENKVLKFQDKSVQKKALNQNFRSRYYNKRANRLTRRNEKRKELSAWIQSLASSRLGRSMKFIKGMSNGISRFVGRLLTPFKLVSSALNRLKMLLLKKIAVPALIGVGGFLIFMIILNAATNVLSILVAKFDSAVATYKETLTDLSICHAIDQINYVQVTVDATAEVMEKTYMETAERDAQRAFNDHWHTLGNNIGGQNIEKIESPKYDWYSQAAEGELGAFYDENGQEVNTITNIIPITNMMHFRFEDSLDYDHIYTMMAYSYYMYEASHREIGYTIRQDDPCTMEVVMAGECTNTYKHGYPKDMTTNTKFLETVNSTANSILYKLNIGFDREFPELSTFYDTMPYDSKGTCDNFTMEITDQLRCNFDYGSLDPNHYKIPSYHCPGYEHTHSSSCPHRECTCGLDHEHNSFCYSGEDCDKEEHTHNENCYVHKYRCEGHCGGHFTPEINIETTFGYEGLARIDAFSTPHFLNAADFKDGIHGLTGYWSLEDWHTEWEERMSQWFSVFRKPGLRNGIGAFGWMAHQVGRLNYHGSNVSLNILTPGRYEGRNYKIDTEDYYDFTGWTDDNGNVDEGLLEDLDAFYGSYIGPDNSGNWEMGIDLWESFDVVFPTGGCYALSSSQKEDLMKLILEQYPNLSENAKRRIETAMDLCGKFSYDIKRPATGAATSGRIDCSGFCSSILQHSNTGYDNFDATASTFAKNGTNRSPNLGDFCAKSQTAYYDGSKWVGGKSNHVVLYIGNLNVKGTSLEKLNTGLPTNKTWIIDCSSSTGGASLRSIDLKDYPYAWTPN